MVGSRGYTQGYGGRRMTKRMRVVIVDMHCMNEL